MIRKLPERGINKDTVSGLVGFLAECDAAIYGGGANTRDKVAFKDGLLELAKHVQKEGR